jgi:hypothetical protein
VPIVGVPESAFAFEPWERRPPEPTASKRVRFSTGGRRTGEMPSESTDEFPLSVDAFLIEKRLHLPDEMQVELPDDAVLVSHSGLKPMDFQQDKHSCALDAFNLAVGRVVLKRGCVPCLAIPAHEACLVDLAPIVFASCCRPQIGPGPMRFSKNKVLLPLIAEAGYKLKSLKPRGVQQATLQYLLGQKLGIYLVEFFVQNRGKGGAPSNSAFHVVVVDCFRRLVLCNTIGILPFNLHARAESEATHAEIRDRLRVRNVCAVWVLCKVASV